MKKTISLLKNIIKSSNNIAIIGHNEPDTDALASMLILKRVIESCFYKVNLKVDMFAENYNDCELYEPITKNEKINRNIQNNYDLVLCVDSPCVKRLGVYAKLFNNAKTTISIDHHEDSEQYANYNYIYKCSSTCEVLFVIFKSLNIELSCEILKLIYAGIITE